MRDMENANAQCKDCGEEGGGGYGPTQRKRAKTPPASISPLLINHVLEQIFYGGSHSDLIKYRLVCREWNIVATKYLQSRLDFVTIGCRNVTHVHSLHYRGSLPQEVATAFSSSCCGRDNLASLSRNVEQLERFLKVISFSTNPPCTKYEIVSSFFVPQNEQLMSRFFQLSSPFIQVLKISLDNRAPGEFSPQFLANAEFPKLKTVVFEVLRQFTLSEETDLDAADNSELRDNAISYRILSRITFGATNLESLEVSLQRKCDGEGQRRFNRDGTPNFERDRRAGLGGGGTCPCQHFNPTNNGEVEFMLPTFSNGISKAAATEGVAIGALSPSTVNNCHLPSPLDMGSPVPRLNSSLKLKRLHLRLRNSFIHQTCITSLLQKLANTLEELCFSEEGHGSRVVVEFPKMKKLSKLTISAICEFEQNLVTVLPFSYGEQLPRLSSLNLWDSFGTEKRYEQLFMSRTASHTLTKLVFPSQFRNVSLAQNIPTIFPYLKSLTMVFSTRTENLAMIETVFRSYGESLEELHLITDMNIQNQNVDHVLTGLPKEICRKMRVEESVVLPLYLQGLERKPSLVDLRSTKKNLKKEKMSWNCCEALSKKCRVDVLSPNGNNVFEIETFDFDFEGI